jgi:hypothetical protein
LNGQALDALIAAETAIIAALDADDIVAIEAALPILGQSVAHLRTQRSWEPTPAILDRLRNAIALTESARVRIRYLADRKQRQLDLLATAAGRFDHAATYARPTRVA